MTDPAGGPDATLFPQPVGERLRAAREARGLSIEDVASRTRIPLRHLSAIEAGDYQGLPSATYAVGFVRAYARAVGADEVSLARDARGEVAASGRQQAPYEPYEIADPARTPSRGLTIVAAGLALAVAVLAALWFASGLFRGSPTSTDAGPTVVADVPAAATAPVSAAARQVTLTATGEVWMRVYDAADKTLYIGTLAAGEKFDVPPGADNPMINIGRPDQLAVTVDGRAIPPLGTGERAIKDVPISAAALAGRVGAPGATSPSPTPTAAAVASPREERPAPRAARSPRPDPNALIRPSEDDETRRANQRSPRPEPSATVAPTGNST